MSVHSASNASYIQVIFSHNAQITYANIVQCYKVQLQNYFQKNTFRMQNIIQGWKHLFILSPLSPLVRKSITASRLYPSHTEGRSYQRACCSLHISAHRWGRVRGCRNLSIIRLSKLLLGKLLTGTAFAPDMNLNFIDRFQQGDFIKIQLAQECVEFSFT